MSSDPAMAEGTTNEAVQASASAGVTSSNEANEVSRKVSLQI
jgi:hypothetical protein